MGSPEDNVLHGTDDLRCTLSSYAPQDEFQSMAARCQIKASSKDLVVGASPKFQVPKAHDLVQSLGQATAQEACPVAANHPSAGAL
jgi:hypothetical protein